MILRLLHQLAQDGVGGVVLGVDDDLALLPPLAGDAAHACRRAQRVHVRIAVAHDVHLPGVVHQLAQGVGHDPGFHLGALFGALGPAAVKLEVQPVLHHRLVAAAAQSHLQGQGRVFEQGVEAVGVPAHADGQGSRHAAGRHLPHGIQHGEAVLGIVGVAALLEHEQIPVPVIVQHQAVGPGGPLIQLLLQLGQHRRALALRAGLHQVLVVIHHQDGHHRPGHLQGLAQLLGIGNVHPIGGGHGGGGIRRGAGQPAVHPIDPVVPHHVLRALVFPLHQPADGEGGHHGVEVGVKHALLLLRQSQEAVVAPHHGLGVHVEHHHGKRGKEHVAGPGGVHAPGEAVHVLAHALLHGAAAPPGDDQQHHRRRPLADGQPHVEGDGRQGKQHQAYEIQGNVGAQDIGELFVQGCSLPQAYRSTLQ